MTGWLIDKSALVRLASSPDAQEWADRIQLGLVRISTVTRLEVGYSARSAEDLRRALAVPPLSSMPVEYLTPAIEDRAVEVQAALADRGQHRAPTIPGELSGPASPTTDRRSDATQRLVERPMGLVGAEPQLSRDDGKHIGCCVEIRGHRSAVRPCEHAGVSFTMPARMRSLITVLALPGATAAAAIIDPNPRSSQQVRCG
jgi:predicted nucleic acid-binding protein